VPKIIVRYRRKSLPEDFDFSEGLKEVLGNPGYKIKMPSDCGILTATDYRLFIGFQLCYSSLFLTHDLPVAVFDLGMNDIQRQWCKNQKNLVILRYKSSYGYQIDWKKWHKPLLFWRSPFHTTIWLDSDAVFCGNLQTIFKMYGDQPFFTIDTGNGPATLNPDILYSLLPTKRYQVDSQPYLNAGFMIMNKKRDKNIIQDWCYMAIEAFTNIRVGHTIKLHDQGSLKWAIQKNNAVHCIIQDARYNFGALDKEFAYPATVDGAKLFLQNLKKMAKDVCVVHWFGTPKPWYKWGEIINLSHK
jgi:hypothetical protein